MMVSCLVVDDDRKILDYVKSHLINEHFETHAFLSGEEALHFLEKENVDIAIVDIMMNGINGFELCKTLKRIMIYPLLC